MLVHAIQKRVPLHFSRLGKQLVKFSCTESQFVGVFGRYITRFSLAKSSYYCIFKGENADNILSEIFEDQQWGTRFYDSGQYAYVILYIENSNQQQLSLLQKENSQTKSSLKKLPIQPEMHIQWYTESLTDTKGHFTSSGYISMIFRIDQPQTAGELASILIQGFQDLEDEATELYVYKQATDLDANFPTYNQVKSSRFLNCSNSKPASQPSQLSQRINYVRSSRWYIYDGTISLETINASVIFELLITLIEFGLEELISFKDNLKDLQQFYVNIVSKHPNIIFDSDEFCTLSENTLLFILNLDSMSEIAIPYIFMYVRV
ncbi:hypothetical protein C2G38_2218083 [Gigaspora rosea]|uniref:Uncharacterized protein n=1 Tax=Gigaspora rosea TaxID=44941 RepID=A0A397UB91_9GLOM|nr:hypothetical protein C2G38_2218083 [Gigaspora rosea]